MDEENQYTIRPGDTFWGLESEWGIPFGTLEKLNPNQDPRKLQIGQNVKIQMPTMVCLIAEEIPQEDATTRMLGNMSFDRSMYQTQIDNTYVHNSYRYHKTVSSTYRAENTTSSTKTAIKTTHTARKVMGLANVHRQQFLASNELWHLQKNGVVSHKWKNMSNGASHWKNNIVSNHRSTFQSAAKTKGIAKKALKYGGYFLVAADVGLSGEIKPSHLVTVALIGASGTGVGAIFAGIYFIADIGTGLITGRSIGERLDGWVAEDLGRFEMYEGLY